MRPQQRQQTGRRSVGMPPLAALGRDLLVLTPAQRWYALILPLASAVALGICAVLGWYVAAIFAAAAFTFYSYGSTSHDLVHCNMGMPGGLNQVLLSIIELAGLRSGHAYQAAHLKHHAQFPHTDDVEGARRMER